MTFAERNFVKKEKKKKRKLNKKSISSLTMRSGEHFFSEFYYRDEIVTENEGYVEVLARFVYMKPYNKKINNNLVC